MVTSTPEIRVFGSPHRYIQGPGALDRIGQIVATLGQSTAVLIDAAMHPLLGDRITASLAAAGVAAHLVPVADEVTHANIDRRVAEAQKLAEAPVVIGVGGGKTIDLARAVSWRLQAPFITVPTIASNDSPTAMAIVIYGEDHQLLEAVQSGRNPDAVIVDTGVIIQAPARFLSAGIGDALSKKFEADACRASGGLTPHGTVGLRIANAIADECYRTLREHGTQALAALAAGTPDAAFEHTIEATVLMSGLAFENGGLSIAHSMTRGLAVSRDIGHAMHGEHVAYGLMVQRAVESASDDELADLAGFLRSVKLPASLADLGLSDPTAADLDVLIDHSMRAPHTQKTTAHVDHDSLRAAVLRVEELAASAPRGSH